MLTDRLFLVGVVYDFRTMSQQISLRNASPPGRSVMKLQDINVGARFAYQACVGSGGPITATAEDGSQWLIPQHADPRPLDRLPGKPLASQRIGDQARVCAALDEFGRTSLVAPSREARGTLAARRGDPSRRALAASEPMPIAVVGWQESGGRVASVRS